MKIKAAVVHKANDPYVIEEVDLAEPKANEVLVKIVASGLCHTDYILVCGNLSALHPVVLGHEGSGIVERVGEQVKDFAPGDRVCMSISFCGECHTCLMGKPYECDENSRLNFGGRSYDGTTRLTQNGVELSNCFNQASFATYSVTHQNNLVHVPDDMDLRLTGPLGCGIQTGAGAVLNALKPEPGSSIVIAGCGGVGMSALMAAKICGCAKIIAIDTIDSRLDLALELGATHVINAKKVDPVSTVQGLTDGKGTDYAVNATGNGKNSGMTIECTHKLGKLAHIGGEGESVFGHLAGRTVMGITEGWSIPKIFIPQLIQFYKEGLFPFDKLVKYYDFEDINIAAEDSLSGKTIKPILVMDK